EELMQFARRALWDDKQGGFFEHVAEAVDGRDRAKPFVMNCEAARVLGRLESLHRDPAYQEVAVVAVAPDYAYAAERTLSSQADHLRQRGAGAAIYGIALLELQSAT